MTFALDIGGMVGVLLTVCVLTSAVTRRWDRFTLRMDVIEKDLLVLRERVTHLERAHEIPARPFTPAADR